MQLSLFDSGQSVLHPVQADLSEDVQCLSAPVNPCISCSLRGLCGDECGRNPSNFYFD